MLVVQWSCLLSDYSCLWDGLKLNGSEQVIIMSAKLKEIVEKLNLQPHPEGGYFAETYRSEVEVPGSLIGAHGPRQACTGIYFLIPAGEFSAFHRIKSDEMWHFYAGDPLLVHQIFSDGSYECHHLGSDIRNQVFQAVVPAGAWFASEPDPDLLNHGFSLVGCTVSPGFDFSDFELARESQLSEEYPGHRELISRLTRDSQ
jgi:predicted cupin superfamily sugar epimerase|tara:strand:+ start:148375 stop:148977 length:603 start_codon:yes stop_codon:yes gene_type:complete